MIRRIAITGPESTGKSILSESLARHFKTQWVPEYAREYLALLETQYKQSDILEIAKGQLCAEEEHKTYANNFLFCDTDLLVTKIWSEVKYGNCDEWILQQLVNHSYDLFLLCDIDLPWAPDPLREHPNFRKELFDIYLKNLKLYKFPFAIVRGTGIDRMNNAIKIIDEYFIHTPLVSK